MAELKVQDQRLEYQLNSEYLGKVLGCWLTATSHPSNFSGPETLDLLLTMGVTVVFSANMLSNEKGWSTPEYRRKGHSTVMIELRAS